MLSSPLEQLNESAIVLAMTRECDVETTDMDCLINNKDFLLCLSTMLRVTDIYERKDNEHRSNQMLSLPYKQERKRRTVYPGITTVFLFCIMVSTSVIGVSSAFQPTSTLPKKTMMKPLPPIYDRNRRRSNAIFMVQNNTGKDDEDGDNIFNKFDIPFPKIGKINKKKSLENAEMFWGHAISNLPKLNGKDALVHARNKIPKLNGRSASDGNTNKNSLETVNRPIKLALSKSMAVLIVLYGFFLTLYGHSYLLPQMKVITVARTGGFQQLEQSLKSVFATKLTRAAITKGLFGATFMGTSIFAIFGYSSPIGNFILNVYVWRNMSSLFWEANRKAGYPFASKLVKKVFGDIKITNDTILGHMMGAKKGALNHIQEFNHNELGSIQGMNIKFVTGMNQVVKKGFRIVRAAQMPPFIKSKIPFLADDFLKKKIIEQVGAVLPYTVSGIVMFKFSKSGWRINSALIASSVSMRGFTTLLNNQADDQRKHSTKPGLLRGFNGGWLTYILTLCAITIGILVEKEKIPLPEVFTYRTSMDEYLRKGIALGKQILVSVCQRFGLKWFPWMNN